MSIGDETSNGPPAANAVHICVDTTHVRGKHGLEVPCLPRVVPNIVEIAAAHPERTLFTRFIPAKKPGDGDGMWRNYYRRWSSMTIDHLGPEMTDLVPDLVRFVPPASTFDKHVYSPWTGSDLHAQLRGASADTVIVKGGETDVRVLATVLGAIDWGFRVILVTDAPVAPPMKRMTLR